MTKTEQIIAFVKASPTGRRFSEIQRFVVELKGYNYDEMQDRVTWSKKHGTRIVQARRWRGYWCTYLLGGGTGRCYGRGALRDGGCEKVGKVWQYVGA